MKTEGWSQTYPSLAETGQDLSRVKLTSNQTQSLSGCKTGRARCPDARCYRVRPKNLPSDRSRQDAGKIQTLRQVTPRRREDSDPQQPGSVRRMSRCQEEGQLTRTAKVD
ncbi:hypothetical protein ElyMa_005066300 [Elysia marginata]|uniref:Uncharacterized protein n=1 Tax=Elysia marginata TaxID=1093978 RepID=A0AAV4JDB4_9GAST|nr:hypothetical protein ElyMa_005066300 [Elysia marginata]